LKLKKNYHHYPDLLKGKKGQKKVIGLLMFVMQRGFWLKITLSE